MKTNLKQEAYKKAIEARLLAAKNKTLKNNN